MALGDGGGCFSDGEGLDEGEGVSPTWDPDRAAIGGAVESAGVDDRAQSAGAGVGREHGIGVGGGDTPIGDGEVGSVDEIDLSGVAAGEVDEGFLEVLGSDAVEVEIADVSSVDEGDRDRGVGGTAAAVGVDDAAGEVDFF